MSKLPHTPYAVITGTFLSLFTLAATLIRRNPRYLAQTPPARDLFLLGVATFRFSRLITHDRVTTFFRAPFVVEGKGYEQIEGTQEEPTGTGFRLAIGQLLTCPWCASVWAGAFNTALLTFFPRVGRYFLMILAASGMSEILDPIFPLLNYLAGYVDEKQKTLEGQ